MEHRYVDLFSDGDLAALGRYSGHGPPEGRAAWFRSAPARIEAALDDPATADAMFRVESDEPTEPLSLDAITPLLVFAVVVHRAAADVGDHRHLPERYGSRLVIPIFDGDRLATFAATRSNRVFLVELLGSYTRVTSGAQWERSRGRLRRRRFSELNPAQLARLAAGLPTEDRAGAYRRLGDLALFLNGVFPDHAARQTLAPIDLERILASLPDGHRLPATQRLLADRLDASGPVLAALGPTWYRLASELVPIPSMSAQLADIADGFEQARRFLAFVTDRWLWPRRGQLFPAT